MLPRYIETQRWYAAKGSAIERATLIDSVVWERGDDSWLLPLVEVRGGAASANYFVPFALAWEERDEERARQIAPSAIARVRQQAQLGVMGDAFADEPFCRALLEAFAAGNELKTALGSLHFLPTASFAALAGEDLASQPITRPSPYSSNTVVTVGERLLVKAYRCVRAGITPEVELGRHLTEVARFAQCAPLAGVLEYRDADGTPTTLALVQGYVEHQADGWGYSVDYLQRYLELWRAKPEPEAPGTHGGYLALIGTLGRRTAEMHLAFALRSDDAAFDPEPLGAGDVAADARRLEQELDDTLALLQQRLPQLPSELHNAAQAVLSAREALRTLIERGRAPAQGLKTRLHGDYHLGQVLLAKNDFVIIDFEGEPGRTLAERRAKRSPLRDVAGMLRSFSYAAQSALRSAARAADDASVLAPPAARWQAQAREAFLRGYDAAAAAAGAGLYDEALLPGTGLLGLYELDKALYELRYELNNRPDWVGIPVQGLLDLLAASPMGVPNGTR